MSKKTTNDMRHWARLGAEQRLHQLAQETAAIHAAFPELRQVRPSGKASLAAAAKAKRRRPRLSADARKRISEAQKARWAKQKAQKK